MPCDQERERQRRRVTSLLQQHDGLARAANGGRELLLRYFAMCKTQLSDPIADPNLVQIVHPANIREVCLRLGR